MVHRFDSYGRVRGFPEDVGWMLETPLDFSWVSMEDGSNKAFHWKPLRPA